MQLMPAQRKKLLQGLMPVLENLAKDCAAYWQDSAELEDTLRTQIMQMSHCQRLFIVDKSGVQLTASFTHEQVDVTARGRDLRQAPYAAALYPKRHLAMSIIYPQQLQYLTVALQPVVHKQVFLGFIAVELDVSELVSPDNLPQVREGRDLDSHLQSVFSVLEVLMSAHGVFHCQMHYVSGQVQLWHVDDPFQYRLYRLPELLEPGFCQRYEKRAYPAQALLQSSRLRLVLERFHLLRCADEEVYLRSSSLNLVNAQVGLSFSNEGSRYFHSEDFLEKDWAFWEYAASCPLHVELPNNENLSFTAYLQ